MDPQIENSTLSIVSKLVHLIKENKENEVLDIIQTEHLVNCVDSSGSSLVHHASNYGNGTLVQYFVDKKWVIDSQNNKLKTPLMLAIENKHAIVVDILLKANVNVDISDASGRSVLEMFFSIPPHPDQVVKILNQFKVKYCDNQILADRLCQQKLPFPYVIFLKDKDITKRMLELGNHVCTETHGNMTALHLAALLQDLDNIKLLVEYGANVLAEDEYQRTPLFMYFSLKTVTDFDEAQQILTILSKNEAVLTKTDIFGFHPIFLAMSHFNRSIIKLILGMKIDLYITDKWGRSFLFYLISNKNSGVFEEFHNFKFDINIEDFEGDTPLHLASRLGYANAVKFLLNHKADIHKKDVEGFTALEIAKKENSRLLKKNYVECIDLLEAARKIYDASN